MKKINFPFIIALLIILLFLIFFFLFQVKVGRTNITGVMNKNEEIPLGFGWIFIIFIILAIVIIHLIAKIREFKEKRENILKYSNI